MKQPETIKKLAIPKLMYDGGSIDVLWDHHEEAMKWYHSYLGWNIQQQEPWTADPRAIKGQMTHMGWGTWLVSYITNTRLPYHFADRGSVDPNVRWCWRTRDIRNTHSYFKESGIRVTEIYQGPAGYDYFDFWATNEGTRLTAQGDPNMQSNAFEPSWTRIGVSNLDKAVKWYETFVGMELDSEHYAENYAVMKLGLNHHPGQFSTWILEKLPEGAFIGKVDGTVRPTCWIQNREQFFEYHRTLEESGVQVGEIGGFTARGMVHFHFYDEDGNRFNVSSM